MRLRHEINVARGERAREWKDREKAGVYHGVEAELSLLTTKRQKIREETRKRRQLARGMFTVSRASFVARSGGKSREDKIRVTGGEFILRDFSP